jgi:hypothetical protein
MCGCSNDAQIELVGNRRYSLAQFEQLRTRFGYRLADAGADFYLALQHFVHDPIAQQGLATIHETGSLMLSQFARLRVHQKIFFFNTNRDSVCHSGMPLVKCTRQNRTMRY